MLKSDFQLSRLVREKARSQIFLGVSQAKSEGEGIKDASRITGKSRDMTEFDILGQKTRK
jgi:hypothetical protein